LIEVILSSKDDGENIRCLPGDDAQTFVDVIDEVRSAFTSYHETNNVLATRHCIRLVSPHWLKRNALDCYTGHVANAQFFREL